MSLLRTILLEKKAELSESKRSTLFTGGGLLAGGAAGLVLGHFGGKKILEKLKNNKGFLLFLKKHELEQKDLLNNFRVGGAAVGGGAGLMFGHQLADRV